MVGGGGQGFGMQEEGGLEDAQAEGARARKQAQERVQRARGVAVERDGRGGGVPTGASAMQRWLRVCAVTMRAAGAG